MKAYIITVITSFLFAFIGEEMIKKKKKLLGIGSLVFSLLILCIVAGARDLNVGKDIYYYFYQIFYDFSVKGYSIIKEIKSSNVEVGFIILVYVGSLLKNVNFALFLVELFTAAPIYIYAFKKRNEQSISFIILVFILTMYVRSFNLMRQSIAMSLVILSTAYFEKKDYKKTTGLFIAALTMHTSALAAILIYAFIIISKTKKDNKKILLMAVYFGLIVFVIGSEFMLKALFSRYARYIGGEYSYSSLNLMKIMKKMIWIFISAVYYKYALMLRKKEEYDYKVALVCLNLFMTDFILSILSIKIGNAGRIGYYFLNLGYILLCPNFLNICKQKSLVKIGLIFILFLFWYNMTAVINSGDQTYPYMSEFLTFLN